MIYSKMGIPEATKKLAADMQKIITTQVIQWMNVFLWKCDELRMARTNMYLAPMCTYKQALISRPTRPTPYATFLTTGPALPRDGEAIHCPHHLYTTRLKERYDATMIDMHK